MHHRARINIMLLATVTALALAAWLLSRGDSRPAPLTGVDPGGVRAATLRFPGGERPDIRLERRQDGWHVVAPIERAASDGRIVAVLAILRARSGSCYDTDAHAAADFGLDTPRAVLAAAGTEVAFGDRAADGRRYVRGGGRFCLVPDSAYPLLEQGLDGLAATSLLRPGATPVRIDTPAALAQRPNPASPWSMQRGAGDAEAWAARWRAANAGGFLFDLPAADHGRIRVTTADGATRAWRIARRDPDLVLVPEGAGYGLVIPAERARVLLEPPDGSRDGNRDRSAGSGSGLRAAQAPKG